MTPRSVKTRWHSILPSGASLYREIGLRSNNMFKIKVFWSFWAFFECRWPYYCFKLYSYLLGDNFNESWPTMIGHIQDSILKKMEREMDNKQLLNLEFHPKWAIFLANHGRPWFIVNYHPINMDMVWIEAIYTLFRRSRINFRFFEKTTQNFVVNHPSHYPSSLTHLRGLIITDISLFQHFQTKGRHCKIVLDWKGVLQSQKNSCIRNKQRDIRKRSFTDMADRICHSDYPLSSIYELKFGFNSFDFSGLS